MSSSWFKNRIFGSIVRNIILVISSLTFVWIAIEMDFLMNWETIGSIAIILFAFALFALNVATLDKAEKDERLRALQIRYLTVYSLAVAADWLQGPYMYALYESYDLSVHSINLLFVGGFGASLVAGTFVGSFADQRGRRFNVILYVILYIVSCITKHSPSFTILFLGRITGGIATSILFSAFESWLVYEHKAAGFSPDLLSTTFSYATLLNSAMAIFSGFLAQAVVSASGQFVSAFDASIVVLAICGFIAMKTWGENFGDVDRPLSETLKNSWAIITSSADRRPLLLGIAIALFEAAMYMFVLEWTPALKSAFFETGLAEPTKSTEASAIPYGLIFSGFMVACMAGSVFFKYLTKSSMSVEQFLTLAVVTSAICLACPILPGVSSSFGTLLLAFVVFEICVGIFWPSTATLRSLYLSEESRCTIMNFYRVPLNLAVVMVLCFDLNYINIFMLAVGCLAISAFCFASLEVIRRRNAPAYRLAPSAPSNETEV